MRARFITFEGLDGSGKSTHLRRAAQWMEARRLPALATHEPGGTPLGDALRDLFLDPRWGEIDGRVEALIVFASRRQHLLEVIEPALAAGQHVLCDRFTDSSLAYQGSGRGLTRGWIERLDELATGGRQPDHTLFFDLSAEAAYRRGQSSKRRQRGDADRLDVEQLSFYRRVYAGYHQVIESQPQRFSVIDSSGGKEETWNQVERVLSDLVRSARGSEA